MDPTQYTLGTKLATLSNGYPLGSVCGYDLYLDGSEATGTSTFTFYRTYWMPPVSLGNCVTSTSPVFTTGSAYTLPTTGSQHKYTASISVADGQVCKIATIAGF